jgi:hypothetical protein
MGEHVLDQTLAIAAPVHQEHQDLQDSMELTVNLQYVSLDARIKANAVVQINVPAKELDLPVLFATTMKTNASD